MNLILAEKPSQAKEYLNVFSNYIKHDGFYEIKPNSYFSNGAYLSWGIGHLVTLKDPVEYNDSWASWSLDQLPMIPSQFQYKVPKDKQKQFKVIKKLLSKSSCVVIATDTDREGENIARSIINLAGFNHLPTKRLWFNSLEVDELERAFNNLKDGKQYIPLYHEAQSRQIGDWLVGLNASRLYTKLIQKNGLNEVFSVGRVQTPTLALIYQRQKEIESFKSKPFFEIHANLSVKTGDFKGKAEQRFDSIREAKEFLSKHQTSNMSLENFEVVKVIKTEKETKSPKLFSLSSLQSYLNKKYKYGTKKSLKLVQELYDSPLKLLTYPRTSTEHITEHEFEYLKKNLKPYQNLIGNTFEPLSLQPNKRYVDSSKVQEHYAIIPTKNIPSQEVLKKLTQEQKNVYFEVIKRTLSMFHAPYQYEETEIHTNINNIIFKSKGKTELNKGWKSLYKEVKEDKEPSLPKVAEGLRGQGKPFIHEGETKPPKRYTEGQLITLMKTCGKYVDDDGDKELLHNIEGLGTEATRSGIIDTLQRQDYIEIKKNIVYVTDKGKLLLEVLKDTLLAKPDLTAKWESYLKKIGKSEGQKDVFLKNIITFVEKIVKETKDNFDSGLVKNLSEDIQKESHITSCPKCKKGFIADKKSFYGCTEYKNGCKFTIPKKRINKTISKKQVKDLIEKGKTNKIKGFKGKKRNFDTHLILKDGKVQFPFNS